MDVADGDEQQYIGYAAISKTHSPGSAAVKIAEPGFYLFMSQLNGLTNFFNHSR